MSHLFELTISLFTGNADIILDGSPLASQSQLRVCSIEHFFKWYKSLPSMLLAEVNDDYELSVECCFVQYCLLNAVLSRSPQCHNITFKPTKSNYSIEDRFGWMLEASKEIGATLPPVPSFSLENTDACNRGQVDSLPDSYKKRLNTESPAFSIMIVSGSKEATSCLAKIPPGKEGDDVIIIVDDCVKGVSAEIDTCPIFLTDRRNLTKVIKQWIDINLFYPYLDYVNRLLSQPKKKVSFLCEAKVKMLIREQPVVKIKIPGRIETGSTVPITLDEFPSSNLSVHISDQAVLKQIGTNLHAMKPGTVSLSIRSETGETLCTERITVFFINRVTSITLKLPDGQQVLEGQTFSVIPTMQPSSAQNRDKAVWTTSNGILQHKGGGSFRALKGGSCRITLTIEKVSQSVDVTVFPLPKDIQMPPVLKARVNKTTADFSASLLPNGSACKKIVVRIVDTGIALWDQNQKRVLPVSEGITELIVSGYDSEGNVVVQKKSRVEIQPEKETITPPFISTLSILCLILAALTYRSEMFGLCIIVGLGLSIAGIISGSRVSKNAMGQQSANGKIDLTLGVIGVFVFGFVAAWAFSLL